MTEYVKCFLHKCEDLSSDSRNSHQCQRQWHVPIALVLDDREGRILVGSLGGQSSQNEKLQVY